MNEKILSYERAANSGDLRAALNLGAIYYNGIDADRDYQKAVQLYQRAMISDDPEVASIAINNLGYCYYYGHGVEIDYGKAFELFTRGAILYRCPNCLYKLADMYRYGHFVSQDEVIGYRLLKEAELFSCLHEKVFYADIAKRIAEFFADGIGGITRNLPKAYEYITKAEQSLLREMNDDPTREETLGEITELKERIKTAMKVEQI